MREGLSKTANINRLFSGSIVSVLILVVSTVVVLCASMHEATVNHTTLKEQKIYTKNTFNLNVFSSNDKLTTHS